MEKPVPPVRRKTIPRKASPMPRFLEVVWRPGNQPDTPWYPDVQKVTGPGRLRHLPGLDNAATTGGEHHA